MNLHYTLTQSDYLEAQDVFSKNRGFLSRAAVYSFPIIGVLVIAASIVNFWYGPGTWAASVICLVWGILLIFGRRWTFTRTFAKAKGLHQQFDVKISDQGVELSGLNGKTLSLWPGIEKFAESEDLFLLFCGQRTFHAIPKRAFAIGEADQFRELLRQKVPSKT